jgi:hypothetical protein
VRPPLGAEFKERQNEYHHHHHHHHHHHLFNIPEIHQMDIELVITATGTVQNDS